MTKSHRHLHQISLIITGDQKEARGAHSGESCTGTDADTGGSSRTKKPLSPGGSPQGAQSQVKRTKQKQKETPYNS